MLAASCALQPPSASSAEGPVRCRGLGGTQGQVHLQWQWPTMSPGVGGMFVGVLTVVVMVVATVAMVVTTYRGGGSICNGGGGNGGGFNGCDGDFHSDIHAVSCAAGDDR